MKNNNNTEEIKVILVGGSGVGKTNLINVATGREFDQSSTTTTSCSFSQKEIKYNNKLYVLNIWDTIGQERLRELNKIFYKGAKIVIYVYDITRKCTFEDLKGWINDTKEKLGEDGFIHAICGNKCDLYLNEEVSEGDGRQIADLIKAKFKLTSAKCNKKDFIIFLEELAHDYIDNLMSEVEKNNKSYILKKERLKSNRSKRNSCC